MTGRSAQASKRPAVQAGKVRGELQLHSSCTPPLYAPHRTGGRTGRFAYTSTSGTSTGDVMASKDGRVIARASEFRILRALQRFGWLRTRDLARLCWKRWLLKPVAPLSLAPVNSTASAVRMAQRTLRRLRAMRYVISAQAPDGSIVYTLSESGARALQNAGISAGSGKDLVRGFSSAYFRHRCIANEIAIAGITQGFRVSTEREISQGRWLGGEEGILGKRPDVVLRDGKRVIFGEVEKSRKRVSEYQALLRWLGKVLQHHQSAAQGGLLGPDLILERVIFICTQAFQAKLQRDLEAAGWSPAQQSSVIHYSSDLYMFRDILFP